MAIERPGTGAIAAAGAMSHNTAGQEDLASVEDTPTAMFTAVTDDQAVSHCQCLEIVKNTTAPATRSVTLDGTFDQTECAKVGNAATGLIGLVVVNGTVAQV